MQREFDIPGVSVFRSTLPLCSQVESDYSFCLPESLINVALTRKHHYIAGRYCAIQAAKNLGLSLTSFANAETREPIWPEGMIGSISHSKSIAISCVAETQHYKSIGIDAEEMIKLDTEEKISSLIASPEELNYLEKLNFDFGLTLLFSAKEALYKALFPLGRKFIDFKEATLLKVDLSAMSFELKLESKDQAYVSYLGIYQGQFKILDQNIVSLILVPKDLHAHS
jgi:enterobactin synthetase component D